jgi:hypothetical protein
MKIEIFKNNKIKDILAKGKASVRGISSKLCLDERRQ